jgi:hypothetical protein
VPLPTLQELGTCVQLDDMSVALMLKWLSRAEVQDVTTLIKWQQEEYASSLLLRLEMAMDIVTLFLGHSMISLDVELMDPLQSNPTVLH